MSFFKNEIDGFYKFSGIILLERFFFFGVRAIFTLALLNHFDMDQGDINKLLQIYKVLPMVLIIFGGIACDTILKNKNSLFISLLILILSGLLFSGAIFASNVPLLFTAIGFSVIGEALFFPSFYKKLIESSNIRKLHDLSGGVILMTVAVSVGILVAPIIVTAVAQKIHYGVGFLITSFAVLGAAYLSQQPFKKSVETLNAPFKNTIVLLGIACITTLMYQLANVTFRWLPQLKTEDSYSQIFGYAEIAISSIAAICAPLIFSKFEKRNVSIGNIIKNFNLIIGAGVLIFLAISQYVPSGFIVPLNIAMIIVTVLNSFAYVMAFIATAAFATPKRRGTVIGLWGLALFCMSLIIEKNYQHLNPTTVLVATLALCWTITILTHIFNMFTIKQSN